MGHVKISKRSVIFILLKLNYRYLYIHKRHDQEQEQVIPQGGKVRYTPEVTGWGFSSTA